MKEKIKKILGKKYAVSGFICLGAVSLLALYNFQLSGITSENIVEMHALFVADFSDDRALMGASHNVFVAKVINQIGTTDRGFGPETQFEVEIVENIKGDLQGVVLVNQSGGYKNGVLYVMDDGSFDEKKENNLLQPGSTYILATRYSTKYDWYTLNAHENAKKLISDDQNKDKAQLKRMAGTDLKVIGLKVAYENEVLLEADVINNNTKNSRSSLQEIKEEKEEEKIVPSTEDLSSEVLISETR